MLILLSTQEPGADEDIVVLQAVLTCRIVQFVSQCLQSDLAALLLVAKQASLLKVTTL